jgi:hypothetical protein
VKLKISGVRNTAYTGTALAPTNANVNASANPGRERAARNIYPQTTALKRSRTWNTRKPFMPRARTKGAAATE